MELWSLLGNIELTEKKVWIDVLYTGKFKHQYYGEFNCTKEHLQKAVENFNNGVATTELNGGRVIPFNYQHASDYADPEVSKNSGILFELKVEGDKLRGLVEWTAKAREYIKNKEFLWLSPEFTEDYKDENNKKHGFTIIGGALTNIPFLKKNQTAIAATDSGHLFISEVKMELTEKLNEVLNLTEGQDIEKAVTDLVTNNAELEKKLQDQKSDFETKLTAKDSEIKELKKGVEGKIVLTDEAHKDLKEKAELGAEAAKKLQEKEVDDFIRDNGNKIVPAMHDSIKELALSDMEKAKKLVESMPEHGLTENKGSDVSDKDKSDDPGIEVDNKAKKLMESDKTLNYVQATKKVLNDDPELEKRYNGE